MTRDEVHEVARKIMRDTAHSSRSVDGIRHPDFPRLKACGEAALPAIFDVLKEGPDWHLWAVVAEISGEFPPVPDEHRGKTMVIHEAWIKLAKERGWITGKGE